MEHYLHLKYPIEIVEDEGAWVASVPDLPGCYSYGDTVSEAVESVQKVKDLWIESQYKANGDVPEPIDEDEYSGKFVLRIPKVLHRSLAHGARKQGVSLNHYASHLLAQAHQLNAFENLAQSFLNSCLAYSQGVWAHEQRVWMTGKLPGNLNFLFCLQKPAATKSYSVLTPDSTRQQYLDESR